MPVSEWPLWKQAPRRDTMRTFSWIAGAFILIAGDSAAMTEHDYHVSVDEALNRLEVVARLDGPVRSLRSRSRKAAGLIRNPRTCSGRRLKVSDRQIRLSADTRCVSYEFDLSEAAASNAGRRSTLDTSSRLASPAQWLWQPPMNADTELKVRFDLPDGVNVSVPWSRDDDRGEHSYRFGQSPQSSNAISVFGNFDYREVQVPGATLRVTLLRGGDADSSDRLVEWLATAARGVSQLYGRFPNPEPQILVIPSKSRRGDPSKGSPVPFGRVIRDGGESVQFFVYPSRSLDDFRRDWTATHEFSHLLLPYMDESWISEGFASYFQNVLMARSGAYAEATGWLKLHQGMERARAARPVMTPNQTAGRRNSRMMTYWSGAALALLADVTLRHRSGGAKSLNTVLDQLQACCLPSERTWVGPELFARLDQLSGDTVFMELYRRHADAAGMPDLTTLYRQLGLNPNGDLLELDDNAPGAAIRRAIMAPRD